MTWTPDWRIADYLAEYRAGRSVGEVIGSVLDALDGAPEGILIGAPLRRLAEAAASVLDAVGPTDELPLYGVPFLVKDNIDVAGAETSAGCPGYAFPADVDAPVVALLRAAGAIPVGKSNLDQFATGLVGTRSPHGIPPNTLDVRLVPGGSSSGSAVGVALGLVPFSLGTDTAGSGRVPAAMNGIVGWKPTPGSVSTLGIVPAVRRFDCPSVFARSVAEAVLVASVVSVFDPHDPLSRPLPDRVEPSVRRIGVVVDWPTNAEPDDEIATAYAELVASLSAGSDEIVGVSLDELLTAGDLLYGGPLVAERTAAVGEVLDSGIEGIHPVVRSIIGQGTRYSAVDAYRAEYRLAELRRHAQEVFERIDVLVLPTVPLLPTVERTMAEPVAVNERMGRYTTFVNLLDLAAFVVPVRGSSTDPVPFGVQLIGPPGADLFLATMAGELVGEDISALADALFPPTDRTTVVVVGAHLTGQPLNHQLTGLGARLVGATTTSTAYRLYAIAESVPPKPALVRAVDGDGATIAVEVWSLGTAALGSFLRLVAFPLALGPVELADGSWHTGFVAQTVALVGADDITRLGGWIAYLDRTTEAEQVTLRDGGVVG